MNAVTFRKADYLLYEPRIIDYFINLKVILFLNNLLHFIPSVINACNTYFSDENVITNSYLSVLRPSR